MVLAAQGMHRLHFSWVRRGKTPVLSSEEARKLLDSMEASVSYASIGNEHPWQDRLDELTCAQVRKIFMHPLFTGSHLFPVVS
jgi:hypothetical protein